MKRQLLSPYGQLHQFVRFRSCRQMLPVVLRDDFYRSAAVGSKRETLFSNPNGLRDIEIAQ